MTEQIIYRNGCWGCKKALEFADWQIWNTSLGKDKYICPKYPQHLIEYEKYEQ